MATGMNPRGMRRSRRVACRAKVQLSWLTNGEPAGALVMAKDISQEGMQLEAPAAIPARTAVQFRVAGSPVHGSGTVRSCTRVGGKFILGLTFAVPLKLDPATTPIPGIEIIEAFSAPGAASEAAVT